MAPKAAKRASESLGGSTKRSRGPSTEIIAALEKHDTGLPEEVVRMLSAGAELALRDYKDVRHSYQQETVAWLSTALTAAEANLSQKVEAAGAALRKCEEELQAREGSCKEAQEARDQASSALDEAAAAFNEAAKETAARSKALTDAKKAQTKGDADVNAMSKKKQALENVLAGVYAELKGEVAKKKTLDSFMKTLKAETSDEVLLTTVPAVFSKPPAERSGFDAMVQTQLESLFAGRIAELSSQIDAGAAGVAERAAAVEAASAAVEQATQVEEAAGAKSNEAAEKLGAAEQAVKDAAKAKKEFMLSIKEAENKDAAAQTELMTFSEGPMAAFVSSRDRTTPVLEPEPAAPADPVQNS